MAKIKIRCEGCGKKISVDEAFAGGMCRCPYCKAIVKVPEKSGFQSGKRSSRPDRPDSPAGRSDFTDRSAPEKATRVKVLSPDEIPLADPVRIQGIVSAAMLACLAAMFATGGYVAWKIFFKPPPDFVIPPATANPFVPTNIPVVAGDVSIESPVVYLLDCGGKMQEQLGYASRMVRASVASLPAENKFNVLMLRDGGDKWFSGGFEAGGQDQRSRLEDETISLAGAGRTDLAAGIRQALAMKPKTLVVLANKSVDDAAMKDISDVAKSGKTVIVCICVNPDEEAAKNLEKLAGLTGGKYKSFGAAELDMMGKDSKAVK